MSLPDLREGEARARWAEIVPQRRYRLTRVHPDTRPTGRTYWTAPDALYDPTGTFRVCECGAPLIRQVRRDGIPARYPKRCRACK